MALDPLIPYLPTEELVTTILPAGAFGDGLPPAPIAIQPFGALVAAGVYLGALLTLRQARRMSLEDAKTASFIAWVVGVGFVMGHVLEVVLYRPRTLLDDPLALLRIWQGLSSYAGFIGGVLGAVIWRARSKEPLLPYADALASAAPVGWMLGRAGCAVAHDHPGLRSNAWFAVQYPDGGRFDLGLYELVLTIPLAVTFLWLRRQPRAPGFFVGVLVLYYAPLRFALDFLRVRDTRYLELTPAQWLSIVFFLGSIGLLLRARRAGSGGAEHAARRRVRRR